MSDSTVDPVSTDPAVPSGPDPSQFHGVSTPGAGTDAPTTAPTPTGGEPEKVQSFSADYVAGLRAENARVRTDLAALRSELSSHADATAAATQQAIEQVRQEMAQAAAKAFGFEPEDTPPDPTVLLDQARTSLTQAEAATAAERAARRASEVKLAVLAAADAAEVHGAELLDSVSFMADTAGLDPAAADFADQVAARVVAAAEARPSLKRAAVRVVPARSGGDMSAGNADTSRDEPPSVESLRRQRAERRSKSGRSNGRTVGTANGAATPIPAEWANMFNS